MLTIRRNHVVEIFNDKGVFSHKDSVVCCFKHAIQLALEGEIIEEEVDEFGRDEYDMRTTTCFYCEREKKNKG
jgi:hypothetical protein